MKKCCNSTKNDKNVKELMVKHSNYPGNFQKKRV